MTEQHDYCLCLLVIIYKSIIEVGSNKYIEIQIKIKYARAGACFSKVKAEKGGFKFEKRCAKVCKLLITQGLVKQNGTEEEKIYIVCYTFLSIMSRIRYIFVGLQTVSDFCI